MKKMNSTMLAAGLTAVTLATGCSTVKHSREDLSRVPSSSIVSAINMAHQPLTNDTYKVNTNTMNYPTTAILMHEYRFVDPMNVQIYTPKFDTNHNVTGFNVGNLNLLGPRNGYASQLNDLETVIGERAVTGLDIGSPDSRFSKGKDYQDSNSSKLLGVRNYSNPGAPGFMKVITDETILPHQRKYTVTVDFGVSDVSTVKHNKDAHLALQTAGDFGIGWLVGGPIGAGGFAANDVADYAVGLTTQGKLPQGTSLSYGNKYITSLPLSVANTTQLLNDANRLGAEQIILVPNNRGVGVALVNGAHNVHVYNNGVLTFETSENDARWVSSVLNASRALVGLGIDQETKTVNNYITVPANPSSGVDGGNSRGPGVRH